MKRLFRLFYLNAYAFLTVALGLCVLGAPLYKLTPLLLAIQIPAALFCFYVAVKLLLAWKNRIRLADLLIQKNQNGFNPESFKAFMQAPCSRLAVKYALKELHSETRYGELKIYRIGFFESLRNAAKPLKTRIYINEDYV